MPWTPAPNRYDSMPYRLCGRSGLKLPALSMGLWHNFGDTTPISLQREMVTTAFDLGITHFDLANNYGPPYGSAETNFGRILREDLKPYRDELILSSKAGWDMWPGPYGQGGGSRKYVLASLDQSLKRLGTDYVDIFYSHRFDAETPLEETAGALATAVQDVLHLLEPEMAQRGVAPTVSIAPDLPAVLAEPVALQQIVHNLLMNALQALDQVPPAERQLVLRLWMPDAEHAALSVRDHGPGVPPEARAHLFEPFYTTRSGGLGLGLTLCESLAQAMGAQLALAPEATPPSAAHRGAEFVLTLQAASPPDDR